MKRLIKPIMRLDNTSELVQAAVKHARLEFMHRQEVIELSALLPYVEDQSEVRRIETRLLKETSAMVFDMAIKEDAVSKMSSREFDLYKSMI